MAYYANSDPYLGRSLSRRPSIGYPGSAYPHHQVYPSGGIAASEPTYQIYGTPGNALVPSSRRLPGAGYDNYTDPYYHDRPIPMSRAGSIAPISMARRHSTVSYAVRPPPMDAYRYPSGVHIKFRRKGAFTAGLGLDEAQSRGTRLSHSDAYSYHDLHADQRGCIFLKIKWVGHSSMTYEIPLSGYDGRLDLETLARRVSRACVHYLQANIIPVLWDRVQLHHLEEVSYGVWQPMLSTQ